MSKLFKPVTRILLKIIELIGCIACVITKALTDAEARRIALRNQKFSREWSLLNNVTWSREGNAFANITYGGYTLIISLILITRCINAKQRPNLVEKVFLTVGMLFFFAMGGLVYASLEQVPADLQDNALILGSLSFFVALVLLIDLADPMAHFTVHASQTEQIPNIQTSTQTTNFSSSNEIKELNIPITHRVEIISSPLASPKEIIPPNGNYYSGDRVDSVEAKVLPKVQHPVFAKILMPEKRRPFRKSISQPMYSQESLISSDGSRDERQFFNSRHDYVRNVAHQQSDEDNINETRGGFVAQAARMWDRRAKRSTNQELSTIV